VARASTYFSAEEKKRIEAAIGEAEARTAGEIVPVVATASGRYDRGEDLFGLVCAIIALVVAWWLWQGIVVTPTEWALRYDLALGLPVIVIVVVAAFLLGAVVATYVPALRLPFISSGEMQEEVERSAAAAFQRFRVRRTAAGTGVLIYVSLYERVVRVLGDDAINAKVVQAEWDAVCTLAVEGLRANRGAAGLADAVRKAGELLSRHFPRQPDDRDELVNELHFID
jgi:putative membrane protein